MPRSDADARAEYQREYRARKRAEKNGGSGAARKRSSGRAPAARSGRRHRDAVARMLRTTGLAHVPEEAPLVQLLKDLAYDLDAGEGKDVYAKYLAALKDVRRVLAYSGARPTSSADPAPAVVEPEPDEDTEAAPVNSLAAFREKRGIGA